MPRSIRETTRGQIRQPPPLRVRDGKIVQQTVDDVNQWLREIADRTNLLSFGDGKSGAQAGNIDGQIIANILSPAGGGATEFRVSHGLGRSPVGFLVTWQNKAGTIYSDGRASWNSSELRLRCDVTRVTFDMIVW